MHVRRAFAHVGHGAERAGEIRFRALFREADLERARRFLKNAGVKDIFCVSVTQGTGMEALRAALLCRQKVQERPEHCHLEDAEVYS